MKKRDGKIELLRFIMTCSVIIYHISNMLWDLKKTIGIFSIAKWSSAVDFFFLLSGILMAKSIYKKSFIEDTGADKEPIGVETRKYIFNKAKGLLPYYLFYCGIMAIYLCIHDPSGLPWSIIKNLPSLFFLSSFGISGSESLFLFVAWYLSSMLICMAIIYPLCRKYYHTFTNLIAPLIAGFVLGYCMVTKGTIDFGRDRWTGITFYRNLRAFADISLGTTLFEISRCVKQHHFKNSQKCLVSIAELLCYLGSILIFFSKSSENPRIYTLMLLAIGLTLTFTEKGLLSGTRIFNNSFTYFLGNISYSIYLIQSIIITAIFENCSAMPLRYQAILMFVLTVVLGTAVYIVGETFKNQNKKLRKHRAEITVN